MASLIENLAEFQIENMQKYGQSVALVDAKTKICYTYANVIDRIHRLAAGLQEIGLRQGDVLCALTFNHIEYAIIWYAVNMLGATFQSASPFYTDDELEKHIYECKTKFLITVPEFAKKISRMVHNIKLRSFSFSKPNLLNRIIVIGESEGFIPYESLFTNKMVTKAVHVNPNADSILLSTSGTNGLQKYVRLSHANIAANMQHIQEAMQQRKNLCTILCLSLFHHQGVQMALGTGLCNGFNIVVMEKFDIEQILSLIQLHKAEVLQIDPTMATRLVKYTNRSRYDLKSVQYIQVVSAPLGVQIESQLRHMFNFSFIANSYSLTETGFIAGKTIQRHKPGSSGVVPYGILVKIVDPDSGILLPPDKIGEICVTGPQVTSGYLNNPQWNKEAFDEEGYFKTGDLGYVDAEGFLYVIDKLTDMIKNKDLQISPAFLEDILLNHPDITDACVVGITDTEDGELPKAIVVKQQGSTITEADVLKHVENQVASHMRLSGGVEFVSEIPRIPSGKINRRILRDSMNKSKL